MNTALFCQVESLLRGPQHANVESSVGFDVSTIGPPKDTDMIICLIDLG